MQHIKRWITALILAPIVIWIIVKGSMLLVAALIAGVAVFSVREYLRIIFYCEGEPEQHLKEGDMFAVPSGKNHTIKLLTREARLIDSFNPIREDFL